MDQGFVRNSIFPLHAHGSTSGNSHNQPDSRHTDMIPVGVSSPSFRLSGLGGSGERQLGEGVPRKIQALDPVQRARHADSQRSRLIFGSRLSPQVENGSQTTISLKRNKSKAVMNVYNATEDAHPTGDFGDSEHVPSSPILHTARLIPVEKPAMGNLFKSTAEVGVNRRFDIEFGQSKEPTMSHLAHKDVRLPEHHQHSAAQSDIGAPRNDLMPSAYSRSASVVSTAFGRQDEDISSIMMRGATDLRNAKFEVEEQRREIAFLQTQLDNVKSEKEEALKRLKAVKDAAKRSLENSSKSLSGLESVINDLKAQSQTSFDVVTQARNSIPDVKELRHTISEALKTIEPLLDEHGQSSKAAETKLIISDLELECEKTRQVVDILRDRLQSVGAELVDAKGRVADLEASQVADRAALSASNSGLMGVGKQHSELADGMKRQQREMYEILSTAADAESKLAALNEGFDRLNALVAEKDAIIEELRNVQSENTKLKSILDDCEAKLHLLEHISEEMAQVRSSLSDREATIRMLEASVITKEENIADLKVKLAEQEKLTEENVMKVQLLQENARAHSIQEEAWIKQEEYHISDTGKLQKRLEDLECRLEEARKGSALCNDRLHEANARFQVLEERFEDQSVTLRITRESNGDLQERLIAAEVTYAKNLESVSGKLNCDIALLKEQKSHLQATINDTQAEVKHRQSHAESVRADYEGKLKDQEDTYKVHVDMQEKRASRAECDLEVSRALAQSLNEKLSATCADLQTVREELNQAKLPSPAHQEEENSLRFEIQNLQAERARLLDRAKTVDTRYRNGDLIEEEKTFINNLIHTSQAIHEKELVAKGNELRRRDNAIKELRSKILLLESSLAKHLHTQAKTKVMPVAPATEKQSMINPAAWMSSDLNSSPPASGEQAPDRDAPSTNVDTTVTAKSTPQLPAQLNILCSLLHM